MANNLDLAVFSVCNHFLISLGIFASGTVPPMLHPGKLISSNAQGIVHILCQQMRAGRSYSETLICYCLASENAIRVVVGWG